MFAKGHSFLVLFRKLPVCAGNTTSRPAKADKAPMEMLTEHETNSRKKRQKFIQMKEHMSSLHIQTKH